MASGSAREDLILPLFVVEGSAVREAVASMPGVFRYSVDQVVLEAKRVADLGVPAVILFGIPADKDARGSGADAADGIVQRATRRASSGSWVTIKTVRSPKSPVTNSSISALSAGPRAENASSIRTTCRSVNKTRASAARLCCPPDRAPGNRASIPARPTCRKAPRARSSTSPEGRARGDSPSATLVKTSRCGNRLLS